MFRLAIGFPIAKDFKTCLKKLNQQGYIHVLDMYI